MLMLFAILLMLSIMLKFGRIFQFTDFSLLLFLYIFYALATAMYIFFMAVIFGKANLAAAVSSIVFFISWLPFAAYQTFQYDISTWGVVAICIFPNSAFSVAIALIVDYERQGKSES